ncbi:hypothetical protein [Mitsuaria sp. 7]|uniref:hypothetical protein n=1 Tax=Mitsuaria sp. 7 TaxID=1658665 RepID=UPI0007DDD7B2|nr:hypothetical protein [Mitsuaria sp. 7]ANH67800.1 hypothetical protein ABE85_09825 [Mitsuaria sp. 7]
MRLPRRFDDALMTPPDAVGAADAALSASLRAWCESGAFPTLTAPLRIASIAPHADLDGVACELDGSHELARLSRWQGLWWRLQILWRECTTTRGTGPHDPWDCGWWREDSLSTAEAFRPRRATLLLIREPDAATMAALLATLRGNSPAYTKPVRVLVVSAEAATGMERLYLANMRRAPSTSSTPSTP